MKVINKTRKTVLAGNLVTADNFFSRSKGLLGRRNLPDGGALHIIPCSSIHSFFMRFEFDAIFLNKNNEIVYTISHMPAWRTSKICFEAHSVIELPSGKIEQTLSQKGDVLEIL